MQIRVNHLGLGESSGSQVRLKEMSHTDLFLTMCLRAEVCAEVIARAVLGALGPLLRDGGWFVVWGWQLLPSHLPRRGSCPEGKELGKRQG